MTKCVADKLNRSRKLLLLAAGWMAFSMPVYGQILQTSRPRPSFEVATIKPADDGKIVTQSNSPNLFHIGARSIESEIEYAYNLPPGSKSRILDGPGWITTDEYQIDAKIEDSLATAMQKMPTERRFEQTRLMMQSLLADRLKLKVHFETREMPLLALEIAKGGLKLTQAKDSSSIGLPSPARMGHPEDMQKGFQIAPKGGLNFEMFVKGYTLDEFADRLTPQPEIGGRTVINQTGLSAIYDFTMDWAREQPATPGLEGAAQSSDLDGPGLFAALQQQLGLKLVPSTGPVEVIVIDHVERPSPN